MAALDSYAWGAHAPRRPATYALITWKNVTCCLQIGPFLALINWLVKVHSLGRVSSPLVWMLQRLKLNQPTHRHLVSGFPWCGSPQRCIPFRTFFSSSFRAAMFPSPVGSLAYLEGFLEKKLPLRIGWWIRPYMYISS